MSLFLRSKLLNAHGFLHGFSLRSGGVSAAPFDSLNFGRGVGDDPAAVTENHARLAAAVGYPADLLCEVSQVHGTQVEVVTVGADPVAIRAREGDALVALSDVPIGVRVADCVPILVGDPATGAVSAIHAGWRGAVAGVVKRAISLLSALANSPASGFVAAIGPHIRVGAFEVGEDVARQLAASAPEESVIDRSFPKPHADLSKVVRLSLRRAGLHESRIEDIGGCTFSEPDRFHSYRRDGARSGRHLAVIVGREPGLSR